MDGREDVGIAVPALSVLVIVQLPPSATFVQFVWFAV